MTLPPDPQVDIGVLSGLFSNTTNSYKYLLFHSLLDALERRYRSAIPVPERLQLRELGVGMLLHAWYPRVYFKLSFGLQDKAGDLLDRLATLHPIDAAFDRAGRERLRRHIETHCSDKDLRSLLRYVIQRLIRGFFPEELRNVKDSAVDGMVRELASRDFHLRRPLYRIVPAKERGAWVEVHPDWASYLRNNLTVVRGWAAWEWGRYMSTRNPHIPAVSEKLFPPAHRASLSSQDGFWKAVMTETTVRCIYTGEALQPGNYALDHFLPWKFVLHDRLWNLVPVLPRINSSKSDALPALSYLKPLAVAHSRALPVAARHLGRKQWRKLTESYIADLGLPEKALWPAPEVERLETDLPRAYEGVLPPLLALARQMGFADGWRSQRMG